MVTVGEDPLLGFVIEGRYRIDSVIGQGSAGTVYKATQELIGREVAVKVLHDYLVSDKEFQSRFTQEAKASSRLSHPNIITIYDFGIIPQGGRPYIAMDLLKGTPLSDLIHERGNLTLEEAIPIFKQVCGALGEAHRQGVVHRDIKPENIVLIERSGHKLFPIVVDFGIARLVQEESEQAKITRTGTVCGSPTYMSPEQCTSSKVDHLSDIYSLAVVIYETLTGEVPFLSEDLTEVMAMHLSREPRPLNQVKAGLKFPDGLTEVVSKALSKAPQERFQTMEEFAEALTQEAQRKEKPITPASVPRHEIAPGPLATSDEFKGRHSKDMAIPGLGSRGLNSRELASRALQELRTSDAYHLEKPLRNPKLENGVTDKNAKSQSILDLQNQSFPVIDQGVHHEKLSHKESFQQTPTVARTVKAIMPGWLNSKVSRIIFFGFLILAVFIAFTQSELPMTLTLPLRSVNASDADRLMKQGKFEEALAVVRVLKQQGKLTKSQSDSLDKVCVSLAKQYGRDKDYEKAVLVLEQVSLKSSQAETAKALLKKYSHIK